MLGMLVCAVLGFVQPTLSRDSYGVAHIRASNWEDAFRLAGRAAAEDRLWQMESSRRIARGSMAAFFGASHAASDEETFRLGYTDAELQAQYDALPDDVRQAFASYAAGVNEHIAAATAAKTLPSGYAETGAAPEPWSPLDSAAIAIRLFQLFGSGGAGELRNWAMLQYLRSRPIQDRALDVFDDFLWLNDPRSPTTVSAADDPLRGRVPGFPAVDRGATEAQLAALPKLTLLDLLPAIRVAANEDVQRVAELAGAPFKAGSYAVVVGPRRSASGMPILLSAPQMGHTAPAVIHEMSISCPRYEAVGMAVPGVPGIAIGHTRSLAWGLTSGVADTADVFVYRSPAAGSYEFDGKVKEFQTVRRTIAVKGAEPRVVESVRTDWGPVLLRNGRTQSAFVQRSSHRDRELASMAAMFGIARARSREEVDAAMRLATVSFNCFYALADGNIGFRYVGRVPLRAAGIDPRLPSAASPSNDWRGFVPFEQMPHVENPRSGLLLNWNNKPAGWWPNGDTPVWGRTFRVEALSESLASKPTIGLADVEHAAWAIARREWTYAQTMPIVRPPIVALVRSLKNPPSNVRVDRVALEAAEQLAGFDGWNVEGSPSAFVYSEFYRALREELFLETTGNFMSEATFRTAAQASLILEALEGKTKFPYRGGRSRDQIVRAAFDRMRGRLGDPATWRFSPGRIRVPDEAAIPYLDRGSYIQIVELAPSGIRGRNVVNPGVAERGPHAKDQVPLARSWTYKAMGW